MPRSDFLFRARFDRLETLLLFSCGSVEALVEFLHMAPTLKVVKWEDHGLEDFHFTVPCCLVCCLTWQRSKFSNILDTRNELHLNLYQHLLKAQLAPQWCCMLKSKFVILHSIYSRCHSVLVHIEPPLILIFKIYEKRLGLFSFQVMVEGMSGETARSKKPRLQTDHQSNGGVLNLVDLPEDLLTHIFSLLPTKDVVSTSVLSTEWAYKWASAHHIEIDDKHRILPTRTKKGSFYNFVDRILLHCLNIQNFQLCCGRMSDSRRLKSWISTLSRRNVQSINIVACNSKDFFLPSCLFDNTSLTTLSLVLNCIIKAPINDYLGNLKYLFLSGIHFLIENFSDTDTLILNFRVLESLELNHCTWGHVKFVEITAPALTTFNYVTIPGEYGYLIKVIGARLEKFQVDGVILDNFDLNAKSIVDASICNFSSGGDHPFIARSGSHARISINQFASLQYLRISGRIIEGYAVLRPGLLLPKFGKLETLELSVCDIEALLEFLRMAPTLKLLILDMFFQITEVYNYDGIGSVPSCMMSHLAEIRFSNFKGTMSQLHLLDFLLKNSVKLEKVLVSLHSKAVIQNAKMQKLLETYSGGCVSVVFP